MSYYETKVGKLKKIQGNYDDIIAELLKNKKIPDYYNKDNPTDIVCYLQDEYYGKYFITHKEVYRILENKNLGDDDFFEASTNDDGTINYTLRYYNGGCDFTEALQTALDKI